MRAIQEQIAPHGGRAAKDQVDAIVGRVADQQVAQAVAVHVPGGCNRIPDPGRRLPDERGVAVGQHLGIRLYWPSPGAAINHSSLAVTIGCGRQPHGQVCQAVAVEVAQPGHVDPVVVFVNGGQP